MLLQILLLLWLLLEFSSLLSSDVNTAQLTVLSKARSVRIVRPITSCERRFFSTVKGFPDFSRFIFKVICNMYFLVTLQDLEGSTVKIFPILLFLNCLNEKLYQSVKCLSKDLINRKHHGKCFEQFLFTPCFES